MLTKCALGAYVRSTEGSGPIFVQESHPSETASSSRLGENVSWGAARVRKPLK